MGHDTADGETQILGHSLPPDACTRYRNDLRAARHAAYQDTEAFDGIVHAIERLGIHLNMKVMHGLGGYKDALSALARDSPLEGGYILSSPFTALYENVRSARNDALHVGARVRHLTLQAVQLALILEDALMCSLARARDYMVEDVVVAEPWQLIGDIRRIMLSNSFTSLPTKVNNEWYLLSDFSIAKFLRKCTPTERKVRLATCLEDATLRNDEILSSPDQRQSKITLATAKTCYSDDDIDTVIETLGGEPILILEQTSGDLCGIISPLRHVIICTRTSPGFHQSRDSPVSIRRQWPSSVPIDAQKSSMLVRKSVRAAQTAR